MLSNSRRAFLKAAGTLASTAVLPPLAAAAPATPSPEADHALSALLDTFADELLGVNPELATGLGLDTGAHAALKSRLTDRSLAFVPRMRKLGASMRARLSRIERTRLSDRARLQYETMRYALDLGAASAAFPFGLNDEWSGLGGGVNPYVVSHQRGAIFDLPELLDALHEIESADDAEAYVARLHALPTALDHESERIRRDVGLGVVPPSFILQNALQQMRSFRATPAGEQRLVGSLVRRTGALTLPGDWARRATALVEQALYPALDRQIAVLDAALARASDKAGVWHLKRGGDYYRWALRVATTTDLSPAAVHAMGLAQSRAIQARMDGLLKAQGLRDGSVAARMLALAKDGRFLFPDTDAGRATLIEYVNGRIAAFRPLLAQVSKLGLKADVVVKRVPEDIQDGAPLGYMVYAALDGSRPAIYYINLKSTSLWPKYEIPTLSAHEGVPGHTWQGAYLAEHRAELPRISALMSFNAFVEGWALYAEQLADELGYYADDPFGQLGYLQAQNFRACRLVVDTGLHDKRWTRQQAVAWMVANTGRGEAAITSEVDRYCAWPGQACGYKVGHDELLRLRDEVRTALGARFDPRDFNDLVVGSGGVPLAVLGRVVRDFIARNKV